MGDHLDEMTIDNERLVDDTTPRWGGIAISTVTAVAVGMIVAQLAFRAWALLGGWFQQDDFRLMARAADSDLTWAFVTQSYDGQFMPGGWTVQWVMTQLVPLEWGWHAALLLTLQAVASFGMYRLLVNLFGVRPFVLALLAVYLFSVITLPATIWWAAALNQLPMQIAIIFGLSAHLTYLRTGRFWHALVAAVWAVIGLAFYGKTALLFLLIAFITIGYFAEGNLVERLRSVARRYWRGFALYVAIGLVYVAGYSLFGDSSSRVAWTTQDLAWGFIRVLGTALPTGLLGGPLAWTDSVVAMATPDPPTIQVLVAAGALLLLIEQSLSTRKRAVAPWAFLLLVVTLDLILAWRFRGSAFGGLGLEYRQLTDIGIVAILCFGLAWVRIPDSADGPVTRRRSFLESRRTIIGLVCIVVAVGFLSASLFVSHWHGVDDGEEYFDNLAVDVRTSEGTVDLVDAPVPERVLWSLAYPENLQSRQLVLLGDDLRFPDSSDNLRMVTDEGRIVPVLLEETTFAERSADQNCGHAVRTGPVTLELIVPPPDETLWMRVPYLVSADTSLEIRLSNGSEAVVPVHRGLGGAWMQVTEGVSSIGLRLVGPNAPGATLCTNDITVGTPVPADF